jgi:hypothetical protein
MNYCRLLIDYKYCIVVMITATEMAVDAAMSELNKIRFSLAFIDTKWIGDTCW